MTSTLLTIESWGLIGKIEIGGSITVVRFGEICLLPDFVFIKLIILFMFLISLDLLIYVEDLPILKVLSAGLLDWDGGQEVLHTTNWSQGRRIKVLGVRGWLALSRLSWWG